MSGKRILLALVSLLAVLSGCRKEDNATLTPRSRFLDAGKGSMFLAVEASGGWTLELAYPDSEGGWASLSESVGSGSRNDIILSYGANPSGDPRSLLVSLKPGQGSVVSVTLLQAGKSAEEIPGNYGYDVAPMDWLELPAMAAGDGRELLVHDMQGGKYVSQSQSGVRNWSCYWDYKEHLSLWVAYPLNSKLRGTGGRSDAWGWDALLPQSIQPNLVKNSYGGGWTRGHQIPSADRLTYAANVSTFVPTNMTPQNYDFNGGVWANLEQKVRNYSFLSDTLYVVTGCLFDQSTAVSGNYSGFYVKIPTHYFKALLYLGNDSAAVSDGFMAAGFLLPHNAGIADANCLDYICSVKELEEKTGIDFFPNLPKKLGTEKARAIEEEQPNKFWRSH